MKSNVSPVPKAPVLSPNAAALLSVCFRTPTPHHPSTLALYQSFCRHQTLLKSRPHSPLQAAYVFIYVVPFYLSPATRPSPALTRDAPSSIRARTRAVTWSTFACSALTVLVLYKHHVSLPEMFQLLGLWPVSLFDSARTLLLVAILFAGPIFEHGLVDGQLGDWVKLKGVYESLSSWIGYRNFVVVSTLLLCTCAILTITGTR